MYYLALLNKNEVRQDVITPSEGSLLVDENNLLLLIPSQTCNVSEAVKTIKRYKLSNIVKGNFIIVVEGSYDNGIPYYGIDGKEYLSVPRINYKSVVKEIYYK